MLIWKTAGIIHLGPPDNIPPVIGLAFIYFCFIIYFEIGRYLKYENINKFCFCLQSRGRLDRDAFRTGPGEPAQCSQQLLVSHQRAGRQVSISFVLVVLKYTVLGQRIQDNICQIPETISPINWMNTSSFYHFNHGSMT